MTAIIRALLQFNCCFKSIGYTAQMDNHEKCRLGIFNRINFLGLLTGIVLPVAVPVILVPVNDETVEVHVQDTGKGISSDHMQQLFSNNYFTTK